MHKLKKILGASILVGCLLSTNTVPVLAQNTNIIDDSVGTETTNDFAEDTSYSLLRGNNLNFGTVKITKISSNNVSVYGWTQCHHECDDVYLEVYLERKINGTYSTYKSWSFEDHNTDSLTASIDVIVPSGYYYRVRGYHAAKDGSRESTTTLTSGVLVK